MNLKFQICNVILAAGTAMIKDVVTNNQIIEIYVSSDKTRDIIFYLGNMKLILRFRAENKFACQK
jgi:methenyltetrahydromethanopterin cyclohydrolase